LGAAEPVSGDSHAADLGCDGVFEAVMATKDPARVQLVGSGKRLTHS
jgi:hypothetical protein